MHWGEKVLLGLGILLLLVLEATGIYIYYEEHQIMNKWPSVPARITKSYVESVQETDQTGNTSDHFVPKVQYAYSVDGTVMTGEKLTLITHKFPMEESAKRLLEGLETGTTYEIKMNPENSRDTVIKPGYSWGMVLGFILGPLVFVGLFFGLSFLVKE